jgi:competence protein ComGC
MSGLPFDPSGFDANRPVGYAVAAEPPRTGLATAALICGILGVLCALVGIVGLVLGIVATVRASQEPQRYGGKGMAIAGICTGAAGMFLTLPLMVSILLPSLARAREVAKRAVCAANMRGIGQAVMIYANDNRGAFPADFQALISDGTCTPKQFICPSSGHVVPACDYFYVAGLTDKDPANWIVAFEDPADHHGEGANVLRLDGTVAFLKEAPNKLFTQEVDRFKAAYEKARGRPPRIITPK